MTTEPTDAATRAQMRLDLAGGVMFVARHLQDMSKAIATRTDGRLQYHKEEWTFHSGDHQDARGQWALRAVDRDLDDDRAIDIAERLVDAVLDAIRETS